MNTLMMMIFLMHIIH